MAGGFRRLEFLGDAGPMIGAKFYPMKLSRGGDIILEDLYFKQLIIIT